MREGGREGEGGEWEQKNNVTYVITGTAMREGWGDEQIERQTLEKTDVGVCVCVRVCVCVCACVHACKRVRTSVRCTYSE